MGLYSDTWITVILNTKAQNHNKHRITPLVFPVEENLRCISILLTIHSSDAHSSHRYIPHHETSGRSIAPSSPSLAPACRITASPGTARTTAATTKARPTVGVFTLSVPRGGRRCSARRHARAMKTPYIVVATTSSQSSEEVIPATTTSAALTA